MRQCLIIVAKEPAIGQTKTRLAAGIGAEYALALYRSFLADTITLADGLADCSIALSFWPESSAAYFRQLCPQALLLPQHGTHFGERLLSAFTQANQAGYDAMVLIGSDNPSLPLAYVQQAFAALPDHPAVLGPSDDGGYYLIGMRQPHPQLFHAGIAWSTEVVAEQTRMAAQAAQIALARVPNWYDIDTAEDLPRLYRDLRAVRTGAHAAQTLATLNRLANNGLADLLAPDRAQLPETQREISC